MQGASLFEIAIAVLGGAVAAIGLVLILGGVVGVLRFPDFYTRLHGASAAHGPGAVRVVLGLAIASGDGGVALRLLLLALLLAALAPLLSHLAASAAHGGRLAPLAGRYTAPRPGPARGRGGAS